MVVPQRKKTATQQGGALELLTGSVDETHWWAGELGRLLQAGDVIALHGELGSGKTTFIQGIARGLGLSPDLVKSPTFVLVREYPGAIPVIHVDGYRLSGPAEAGWLDEDLLFSPHKVTVIEWAERLAGLLPDDHLVLQFTHVSTNRRRILVKATGARSSEIAGRFSTIKLGKASTDEDGAADVPSARPSEETDGAPGD